MWDVGLRYFDTVGEIIGMQENLRNVHSDGTSRPALSGMIRSLYIRYTFANSIEIMAYIPRARRTWARAYLQTPVPWRYASL
jgi:hypothetical protein